MRDCAVESIFVGLFSTGGKTNWVIVYTGKGAVNQCNVEGTVSRCSLEGVVRRCSAEGAVRRRNAEGKDV